MKKNKRCWFPTVPRWKGPFPTYSEQNSVCLGMNYPNFFVPFLLKTDIARFSAANTVIIFVLMDKNDLL